MVSWSLHCLSSDLRLLVNLCGISWSLYCLSSDLRLLFTSLVSLGHCIVCPLNYNFCLPLWYILGHCIVCPLIYEFCLPLWYLLVIVLSVLWFTSSVYLFGISWSLYCLSSDLRLLFTSLVSLGHCIVCPLDLRASVYLFGISWSLYCLSSDLCELLFTSLVSLGHCIVCPLIYELLFTSLVSLGHCIVCPLIYDFCLPLWYLLVIILSVLWFTSSVYLFGISWSLYCLFLWFMTSIYLFGISWSLYCLSSGLWLLFTSLVSLGHCIFCPLIYDFSLPLWYLLVIVLSVLWYTTSVYLIGISWSLYCLSSDIRLLFTSLVSLGPLYSLFSGLRVLFTSLVSTGHCIVCSLINEFCLPLWYLLVIVLSVLWSTTSVYLFGIAGHCIVYPLIYDFCLPLWSLSCLSSVLSVLLFTSLVSLGHCIVCPLIYDLCLPLW